MPLALFLVPSWAGQCCHCLLDARVQVPAHFGKGTHAPWRRWFAPRSCSGQVSWLTVVVGVRVSEDKIKGSPECLGLFDVLIRNNYPAQPLLPSCSLQSTRRSGRTKGKGRT